MSTDHSTEDDRRQSQKTAPNTAAGDQLRSEMLGAALDAWEAADGPFSPGDLDAAARSLGIDGNRTLVAATRR